MMLKDEIVEHWLTVKRYLSSGEKEFSLVSATAKDEEEGFIYQNQDHLALVETLDKDLEHIQDVINFAVSELGAIAITSQPSVSESDSGITVKSPSLSVIYPGTDKHVVLSDDKFYWSAVFIQGHGKEYLAATCYNDNSIHLWDVEKGTSKIMHIFQSKSKECRNLCMIDEKTVACVEMACSSDGSYKISILNLDTEPWSLRGIVIVTSVKDIYHMCYMVTSDGTPCLVLCSPRDHCVKVVEMIGSRIRWESGEQQMGTKCGPLSVCTYTDNTICVADYIQNKLHMLSAEDGSLLRSIHLQQYGFLRSFCVCGQDEYVYVGHVDRVDEKPQISKFTVKV